MIWVALAFGGLILVVLGIVAYSQAHRLDLLHQQIVQSRAAVETLLLKRGQHVAALVSGGGLDPASSMILLNALSQTQTQGQMVKAEPCSAPLLENNEDVCLGLGDSESSGGIKDLPEKANQEDQLGQEGPAGNREVETLGAGAEPSGQTQWLNSGEQEIGLNKDASSPKYSNTPNGLAQPVSPDPNGAEKEEKTFFGSNWRLARIPPQFQIVASLESESNLSAVLRSVLTQDVQRQIAADQLGKDLLGRLIQVSRQLEYARRFHNDQVGRANRLRANALVRLLHLAGKAAAPYPLNFDDQVEFITI